ncbi:MAG: hypothetical protein ABIR24_11430 [Verrucomicrobiota bacterium]
MKIEGKAFNNNSGLDFRLATFTFRTMFVCSAKWLIVAALVISLGGHWAILQVAAWANMAVSFSKKDSLAVALGKTFDGKNPCKLCQLVSAGKKAEQKSESKLDTKKLDSFLAAKFHFFFPPLKQFPISPVASLQSRSEVPLSPPPKSA